MAYLTDIQRIDFLLSSEHLFNHTFSKSESPIKENLKSAKLFSKTAAEETRDYKTKTFFGKINYTSAPLFTPKELITIELRIKQTENKSETVKLQKILDSADHSEAKNLSGILGEFSKDIESSKNVEQIQDKMQQTNHFANEKVSFANQTVGENKVENPIQEKGR